MQFLRNLQRVRHAFCRHQIRFRSNASSSFILERKALLENLEALQLRSREEEPALAREFYESGLETCIASVIRKGDRQLAKSLIMDALLAFPLTDPDHRLAVYLIYETLESLGREPLREAVSFLASYVENFKDAPSIPAVCFRRLLTRALNESDPSSTDRLLELCAKGACRDPQTILTPDMIEDAIAMVYLRNHCWDRVGHWMAVLSREKNFPSQGLLVEIFEVALQKPLHASYDVFIAGKQVQEDSLNFTLLQTILTDWHNRGIVLGKAVADVLETLSERILFPESFIAFLESIAPKVTVKVPEETTKTLTTTKEQ